MNKCPTWKGLAMLGDEYSTTTFFPSPILEEPYLSPSSKTLLIIFFEKATLSTKKFK